MDAATIFKAIGITVALYFLMRLYFGKDKDGED